MEFPYTLSDRTFTVFIDGQTYQTDRSNPQWDKIKEAVNDPATTAEEFINLVSPLSGVTSALFGLPDIRVENGGVWFGDEEIHTELARRMLDVLQEGLPIDSWVAFARNVYANPFTAAREELYEWLERADLPITPDGCFLAYKVVGKDYLDLHSHTIRNAVGDTPVMPGGREAVDPDRRRACSMGLHFCSKGYLTRYGYGGYHVMLLKINPADVVAIPTDANLTKGRCWRYEVVGEVTHEVAMSTSWKPVNFDYGWDGPEDDAVTELDDEDDGSPTFEDELTVNTQSHGTLTTSKFATMLASAGSVAKLATRLGVPEGTVQGWKKKLGLVRS